MPSSSIFRSSIWEKLSSSFARRLFSVVEAQMSGLPCILSANITREVALRDDVVFLDIGDGNVPAWARQILTFSRMKIDRETPLPQDCGYDIEKEGEKLAAKYKALAAAAQKNG